nr:hypothetical protein [Tanacetum cinerariifolium]GEV31889.1 hypothetical protein [Tanacetum cinerariifolium]
MLTTKFAKVHNMVAFLSKPTESKGFEHIIDFLNAHSIKYELTKRSSVGDKLGVDCLPNEVIFEQLTLMSAKTTAWNEFSSTIASAFICLAIYQKFNFLKYCFESMVENLDSVTKILMYPRTQKPRITKRKDTQVPQLSVPIESIADEAVNEEMGHRLVRAATISSSLEAERQDTMGDAVAQTRSMRVSKVSNDPLLIGVNTPQSGEDILKLNELIGLDEEDASKQGRIIDDLDAGEDIILVYDQEMFDADKDLQGEEMVVEQEVVADKAPIVDAAHKKYQILFDEEFDRNLHEKINEEERLVRERARQEEEANIALIETWEDIQTKKKRKFFAAKRAEEKRNRLPIKAQQRIYKERKKSDYQIIRVDGKSKNYLVSSYMFKDFEREDLETLWKLVKAKYESTRPEEDYDRMLWSDLKVMFEPHIEDEVWKMQQRYKVDMGMLGGGKVLFWWVRVYGKGLWGTKGSTPPKKARKFKKPASSQLTTAPAGGFVIRETHVMPLSKKKKKNVEKRKGIDLLSEVELTEEAQYEEVRKKSLRDFHKSYLSVGFSAAREL